MATIALTAINPGDDVNAEPLDNNFNTIKNLVNGNIDNANIKSSAAIAWSKLNKSGSSLLDLATVELTLAATIEEPDDSEDLNLFYTNRAITITDLIASVVGSSSPSVTIQIKHSTDRSAAGNSLLTSAQAITGESTGDTFDNTDFDDATIPANSWIWLETSAQSGTVDTLQLALIYTLD